MEIRTDLTAFAALIACYTQCTNWTVHADGRGIRRTIYNRFSKHIFGQFYKGDIFSYAYMTDIVNVLLSQSIKLSVGKF